jgi:thiosulfate reductase cytochrome b subunit
MEQQFNIMAANSADHIEPRPFIRIHPFAVRLTHWINAVAIGAMIASGWRIYNASPLFDFHFPKSMTLGGWLAGALQWHFAILWLLTINGLIYLLYGWLSGHFRRDFAPITGKNLLNDLKRALSGKLGHELGVYNAVQRSAYVGVIVVVVLLVLSGLALWKPVQLQELTWIMGGYEGARYVHFFAMCLLVAFVVAHVIMVLLVPRTLPPMITGRARQAAPPLPEEKPKPVLPSTEAGDAL